MICPFFCYPANCSNILGEGIFLHFSYLNTELFHICPCDKRGGTEFGKPRIIKRWAEEEPEICYVVTCINIQLEEHFST